MNRESYYFDIANPDSVMAKAQTVERVFSDDEKKETITVNVDGNSYEVMCWGDDNQLPYHVKEAVEKNTVMAQDKFFNVLTCYGRGIEYNDLATIGDKEPKKTSDKTVKEFLLRNNVKRFFAEQITDMKYYFFCVCVVILSRDRKRIVRVVHKDACHIRFQKPDEMGRIENVFFASWKDNNNPTSIERIPLLDEYDPLGDLQARTGVKKDPLAQFSLAPARQTKFAIVCRMPTVGGDVYPVPYYTAVWRDGWYDVYAYLTAAKIARIKNSQRIRYHVEINTSFWESRARECGVSLNTPEFQKMKNEFITQLRDYLGGAANSDKLFWSEFEALLDGKEKHNIKINVIDTSKAGNEYNDDVAEVSNVLAYSDNVHPNLAGASPGKSQMNNSGSDKRELFTMKQALETLPHDMMMVVHNTIIYYNEWQDKVYPDVPFIMLTTLDSNTDAKQVSTNNGGKEDGNS